MKTIAIAGLFALVAGAQTTPDARALLKQTEEARRQYKTYAIEQRTVVDMNGPSHARLEMAVKMSVSLPGKMRVESTSQFGDSIIVSDGENTWMYAGLLKQYRKMPAASSPEALVKSMVPAMGDVMDQLKSKDPYLSAKLTGEEALEVAGTKLDCYVVEATLDKMALPGSMTLSGGTLKMWIDKASKTMLKQTFTGFMQGPATKPMEMNMAMTVTSQKLNEPIPDSVFVFTPPEGAKEIADFGPPAPGLSLADLRGQAAADFKLKSLDGKEYSLQGLRGKAVLLDFWATWCAPCRKDLPMFEKLHQEFKTKGLVLLGLNVGEEKDVVVKFLQTARLSYPIALTSGETQQSYSVSAFPTVVLIDRQGKIVVYHVGSGSEAELREGLAKLGF